MKNERSEGKRKRAVVRKNRRAARRATTPQSKVSVTFRHLEGTAALRSYAERKLAHVARYVKRPCEAHLILTVDKYRQHGEVTVQSGRLVISSQAETNDMYAVIDALADKVERQLKAHLEKAAAKRVRALSTGEVLSAAEELPPEPRGSRI